MNRELIRAECASLIAKRREMLVFEVFPEHVDLWWPVLKEYGVGATVIAHLARDCKYWIDVWVDDVYRLCEGKSLFRFFHTQLVRYCMSYYDRWRAMFFDEEYWRCAASYPLVILCDYLHYASCYMEVWAEDVVPKLNPSGWRELQDGCMDTVHIWYPLLIKAHPVEEVEVHVRLTKEQLLRVALHACEEE